MSANTTTTTTTPKLSTKLKTKKEAEDYLRLAAMEKAASESIEFQEKILLAKLFLNSLLDGHSLNDFRFEFRNRNFEGDFPGLIEVVVRNKKNPGFLQKNSLKFTLNFGDDYSFAIASYGLLENRKATLYFYAEENYAAVEEGLNGCEFLVYCYNKLKLS